MKSTLAKRLSRAWFPALALILLMTTGLPAQKLKLEPDQKYLVLSTKKISTMEKELQEAASLGFRVLMGSPTSSLEMALFLERVATPEAPYNYRIMATSRTKTMEKELNDAGRENYRVLPQTFISKEGMFTVEILAVVERSPNPTRHYEYKLVDAVRTPTLHREIGAAQAEGFELIAMVTLGEHIVIMEKAVEEGP